MVPCSTVIFRIGFDPGIRGKVDSKTNFAIGGGVAKGLELRLLRSAMRSFSREVEFEGGEEFG